MRAVGLLFWRSTLPASNGEMSKKGVVIGSIFPWLENWLISPSCVEHYCLLNIENLILLKTHC